MCVNVFRVIWYCVWQILLITCTLLNMSFVWVGGYENVAMVCLYQKGNCVSLGLCVIKMQCPCSRAASVQRMWETGVKACPLLLCLYLSDCQHSADRQRQRIRNTLCQISAFVFVDVTAIPEETVTSLSWWFFVAIICSKCTYDTKNIFYRIITY